MTGSFPGAPRTVLVLAVVAVGLCACKGASGPSDTPAAQEVPGQVSADASSLATPNPLSANVTALKYDGPDDRVLVRSEGKPYISAREYNAWLGSYPLNITSEDPAVARSQAIEQMIMFKLLVRRAREAGYEERVKAMGRVADDRSLALMFIRDQISNVASVSDEEAQEYEKRHPERFPDGPGRLPAEMLYMAVKGSIRGEKLEQEIRGWMDQASLTFEKDNG